MAFNFPAQSLISPSTILPELVISQSQRSGWARTVGGGEPMVRLQPGSKMVYIRGLTQNSSVAVSQSAHQNLPAATISGSISGTPVYILQSGAVFDHHDVQAASGWGVNLNDAIDQAHHQGMCVQLRNMTFYGIKSAAGEGLINAPNVTVSLPPADTAGKVGIINYAPDQLAKFILAEIGALQSRMLAFGQPTRIVICAPQRVLSILELSGIVQLASYQLPGGGTASVSGLVEKVAQAAGVTIEWTVDDTLKARGVVYSGTNRDIIIVTAPDLPTTGDDGTNSFASIAPNMKSNNLMLVDRAAPTKYMTPIARNSTDVYYEMLSTSGWALRPEATTLIEIPYIAG